MKRKINLSPTLADRQQVLKLDRNGQHRGNPQNLVRSLKADPATLARSRKASQSKRGGRLLSAALADELSQWINDKKPSLGTQSDAIAKRLVSRAKHGSVPATALIARILEPGPVGFAAIKTQNLSIGMGQSPALEARLIPKFLSWLDTQDLDADPPNPMIESAATSEPAQVETMTPGDVKALDNGTAL